MDNRSQIDRTLWVHEVVGGSVTNILFKSHSYGLIHSVGHSSSNALVKKLLHLLVTLFKKKLFVHTVKVKGVQGCFGPLWLSVYRQKDIFQISIQIFFCWQNLILPSARCSWINIFCWPWNTIVINQSDLKNQFIVFVKFRQLTISVWCLYISVIHLSFPLILGITHG